MNGQRPTNAKLGQFLGIPSDNGLHHLSGQTQGNLSKAIDNIRSGDGNFRNDIPGQTQKPLSRLYDSARAGNHPLRPWSPWRTHNNAVVVRRNFNNYSIYTPDWYRRYPGAWYPPAWYYGNPWICAPWPTLSTWMGYSNQPVSYDYGDNVVYQDNSVYVNGQDVGTATEYYQQAEDLANSGADQTGTDEKWMSLGVFAVSDGSSQTAKMVLQLAVDKQGIIRGNSTNTTTNETQVIHGAVDKKTERAAWTIGDNQQMLMETGIYNLTKDQTPVLVHVSKDQTKQWLLVRLNQKKDADDKS